MKIKTLESSQSNFNKKLFNHLSTRRINSKSVEIEVDKILNNIKKNKDKGLLSLIAKFDKTKYKKISDAVITDKEIKNAYSDVSKRIVSNLKIAINNIKKFSKQQKLAGWSINVKGSRLGEKVTPLETVGIYVPGGKASYPSTVLMNAIPAKIAGVKNIIMTCPPINGKLNPHVLIAAHLCGVNKIYKFGGAQAVGALAYGTETITPVDKIVGPGNIYVATAKKRVFGTVGIDSFAGPSEILIIADPKADPKFIATDMFAQAEHDELAQAILITTSKKLIISVHEMINEMINDQPRRKIITKSLTSRGLFIRAKTPREIITLANKIAPEHLEIFGYENMKFETKINNAGAIFVGKKS